MGRCKRWISLYGGHLASSLEVFTRKVPEFIGYCNLLEPDLSRSFCCCLYARLVDLKNYKWIWNLRDSMGCKNCYFLFIHFIGEQESQDSEGMLCLYTLKNPISAEKVFRTQSGVTCVQFHPRVIISILKIKLVIGNELIFWCTVIAIKETKSLWTILTKSFFFHNFSLIRLFSSLKQ